MQVIGLTGVAGSGKSTVATYLVEEHGFTRLSFAAPLKKMLRTLDPVVPTDVQSTGNRLSIILDFFEGDETAIKTSIYGKEYRRLLQVLGTDCIRAVDEDFWVNAALKQITDADDKVVFDDVRFPNEAAVISNFNPLGLWNIARAGYEAVNGHASEQHAGKMGELVWLTNDSDVEGLHGDIDLAVEYAFAEVPV